MKIQGNKQLEALLEIRVSGTNSNSIQILKRLYQTSPYPQIQKPKQLTYPITQMHNPIPTRRYGNSENY